MSKRKPGSELNDRNWDIEEEPEEAGTFQLAKEDVLKNRTIRKARRTVHTEESSSGSIFAGFALKTSDSSSSVSKPLLSTGLTVNFGSNLALRNKSNGTFVKSGSVNNGDSSDNPEYLRQLKSLNESILTWIQKHVGENPYCILTPSFQDYEKHLSDLEKKYGVSKEKSNSVQDSSKQKERDAVTATPVTSVAEKPAAPSFAGFSAAAASKPLGAGGFSFGQSMAKTETSSSSSADGNKDQSGKGLFSFGSGQTLGSGGFGGTSSGLGGSSAGLGSLKTAGGFGGFSFGAAASKSTTDDEKPTEESSASAGNDEEYEPPKPEVREIKESGAVYSKRCKLFYQKEGQWADRGVGNLHLKPTDDGSRTQMVIRADTNLGNILLNILLSSAIPVQRQGKNNVFLVCVPNPPINTKSESSGPVPMLLRVKTAEDADELFGKIEEMKA